MSDLFADEKEEILSNKTHCPLAEKLRPKSLDEIIGQPHLLGKNGILRRMVKAKRLSSMIFWGPPGTGKTTIARLLAKEVDYDLQQISAIFSGVAELKKSFAKAKQSLQQGRQTLLFIDEIHRFNRAQQDSFLPFMEDGTIILLGATTENPSFALNSALLSRAQIVNFKPLCLDDLEKILTRACLQYKRDLPLKKRARQILLRFADGDGRMLLNLVEEIFSSTKDGEQLDEKELQQILQRRAPLYDKGQDEHYNLISALHKSIRGSDADAAIYYFSRMIMGGEDPLFLARRLIRMASEDIGLADPNALSLAIAARDAYQMLGSPEGELALAQLVIYLALAPKSNAVYMAYKNATNFAKKHGSIMPPKIILNAPTKLMKEQGYGKNYIYDHDTDLGFSAQNYFPDNIKREQFYLPVERGFERELKKRLDYFCALRSKKERQEKEK